MGNNVNPLVGVVVVVVPADELGFVPGGDDSKNTRSNASVEMITPSAIVLLGTIKTLHWLSLIVSVRLIGTLFKQRYHIRRRPGSFHAKRRVRACRLNSLFSVVSSTWDVVVPSTNNVVSSRSCVGGSPGSWVSGVGDRSLTGGVISGTSSASFVESPVFETANSDSGSAGLLVVGCGSVIVKKGSDTQRVPSAQPITKSAWSVAVSDAFEVLSRVDSAELWESLKNTDCEARGLDKARVEQGTQQQCTTC